MPFFEKITVFHLRNPNKHINAAIALIIEFAYKPSVNVNADKLPNKNVPNNRLILHPIT